MASANWTAVGHVEAAMAFDQQIDRWADGGANRRE